MENLQEIQDSYIRLKIEADEYLQTCKENDVMPHIDILAILDDAIHKISLLNLIKKYETTR